MTKFFFIAIFALAVFTYAAPAQMNPEQAVLSAREQFSNIKNRSMELERVKRESYKRPAGNIYVAKFPAIKEDFESIQKLNDAVVKLIAAKTSFDFAAVGKYVEQINQRAIRLKSNLFSDKPAQKKNAKEIQSETAAPREIRTLLADLDKFVVSFVHSPIFQNLNVVNSTDSQKAQKGLEEIITLSHVIKLQTKK
jgi:hypothetical protein